MKTDIHPKYNLINVTCACGNSFQTRSTRRDTHLEICSNCHPFFTGKQKLVDSAGRVERFTKRFEKTKGKTVRIKAKTKPARAKITKSTRKILSTEAKKPITEKKPQSEKKK